jgi:hypothetical protein
LPAAEEAMASALRGLSVVVIELRRRKGALGRPYGTLERKTSGVFPGSKMRVSFMELETWFKGA